MLNGTSQSVKSVGMIAFPFLDTAAVPVVYAIDKLMITGLKSRLYWKFAFSALVSDNDALQLLIRLAHCKCKSLSNGRSVCRLSRVRSRKLSKIGAKFYRLYGKSASPSKNMTSDFAPQLARYPKSNPKPPNSRRSR